MEHYENFHKFLKDSGNEGISPNQWEVTYVNQIIQGELWNTLDDITEIFPWVSFPAHGIENQIADDYDFKTSLTIGDKLGRLHVSLKRARLGSGEGPDALILDLTARGPVSEGDGLNFEDGFDIGHVSIVKSFDSLISEEAKKHWKRR